MDAIRNIKSIQLLQIGEELYFYKHCTNVILGDNKTKQSRSDDNSIRDFMGN
jgi:hypothetical protein